MTSLRALRSPLDIKPLHALSVKKVADSDLALDRVSDSCQKQSVVSWRASPPCLTLLVVSFTMSIQLCGGHTVCGERALSER